MTDEQFERAACCALTRIFGFLPKIPNTLVDNLGSAGAIFQLSRSELDDLMGPWSKHKELICPKILDECAAELERLDGLGYSFIGITDKAYPSMLRECNDAPAGLYLRSDSKPENIFRDHPMVAVVGTRDLSLYGKEWCQRIVSALAASSAKPCIVSGLAYGVDINAHLSALEYGIPTIGVMATGIDSIYPSRHSTFAERIAATPDCGLVSDYPPGTSPVAVNFLRRNRIIAGMCRATILVESREKGGGILTANLAYSYQRDVYALPGRIDDPRSQGCNRLISRKVAEPVYNLDELIRSLGLGTSGRRTQECLFKEIDSTFPDTGPEEKEDLKKIAGKVKSARGISIEELCSESGLPYNRVSTLVHMLESEGFLSTDLLQRCSINVKKM